MALLGGVNDKKVFFLVSIFVLGLLILVITWKPLAPTTVRLPSALKAERSPLSTSKGQLKKTTHKEQLKKTTLKGQLKKVASKGQLKKGASKGQLKNETSQGQLKHVTSEAKGHLENPKSKGELKNLTFQGQPKNLTEKEIPDLEELLQILQARLQNYSGQNYSWTGRKCSKSMIGASPCYDTACPAQFSPSPKTRLRQVLSARATIPEKYLDVLKSATKNVASHKYIFVTGASSNHYNEMQALLHNTFRVLFPLMKGEDYTLVVYNLGLSSKEKKLTEKHCRCTFIDFPFNGLPDFVKHLKCYVWKPLIVASLLEKAEILVWMDASIRWSNTTSMADLFSRTRASGYLTRQNGGSIAVRTQASMAQFFGDHLCQYAPFTELETGLGFYLNDRFTREAILRTWLSCAFDTNCMCVKNYEEVWPCARITKERYGRCHRFEQSSMGMIYSKLLLERRPMLYIPRYSVEVARGDKMDWFKSG